MEILIVVALLSVIILGLMAMFGQTQRAFRLGLAQTDVLEAGRAATDFFARELVEMRASGMPRVVNFYAQTRANYQPLFQDLPGDAPPPAAPGTTQKRENVLQDVFFLTYQNHRWTAIGYRVEPPFPANDLERKNPPPGGIGALYRYSLDISSTVPPVIELGDAFDDFVQARTNRPGRALARSRVADGVVHLRARAYDTNGVWITENTGWSIYASNRTMTALGPRTGEVGWYQFESNAVPGAVEIELGFLETRAAERAYSIPVVPDDTARRKYLQQQAGRVHLFRQRIPIQTVDVRAYQ